MNRALRALLVAVGLAFLMPSPAHAEPAQATEADALFQHGVELMKADNCADAVPEFLKSNALDASAATLLNLGTCYARLGRKATAWKTYKKAAEQAQAEKDEPLRERALQAMSVLAPTLTKVQIVAPKDAAPMSLRLNGEALVNYDGLPIPLDPGESVIEAAAPGREPWRHSVQADDLGATLVVHVPELPATPAFQALPPPPPPRESPTDLRVPAAIIGGTGVASVIVGSVFGLSAKSSYDDSNQYCSSSNCTPPGIDLRDSARNKAAVSTWTVSLGLVAATTGVVMWLLSPHRYKDQRATARLAPTVWFDGGYTFMAVAEHR